MDEKDVEYQYDVFRVGEDGCTIMVSNYRSPTMSHKTKLQVSATSVFWMIGVI